MNRRGLIGVLAFVLTFVGGVLLFLYVRAADQRALADIEPTSVLVVVREVPEGTTGAALDPYVEIQELPGVAIVPGAVARTSEIPAENVAITTLQVGEQVLAARFAPPESGEVTAAVPIPAGLQLVSVQLSPQRVVGGRLLAGDSVGIFASITATVEDPANPGATMDEPATTVIADGVLVARVQGVPAQSTATGTAATGETNLPSNDLIVTLAVNAPLAERIVFAQEFGSIWLSQQQPTNDPAGSLIIHSGNLFE